MPKYNDVYKSFKKPESDMFIYGLLDPDTNQLVYIGQTTVGLERIKSHYRDCNKVNPRSGKFSKSKLWVSSLKKQNKIFNIVYLEFFSDITKIDESEEFYINYFKFLGCTLLNHLEGGQFRRTRTITAKDREAISRGTKEAMNTPEIKEACRLHALKTVAGYNKGKKFSQEFKDKISKSQEHKAWKFEINGIVYIGMRKAAVAFGCSASALNHYVNGRTKTVHGKTIKFWKDSV